MKTFCFTVDDNIRFLKEITESNCKSIFDHPYLAMYKRLHDEFNLKVQLNLFYRMEGFALSAMSSAYRSEWKENADWLKLSFHSQYENVKPYAFSGYRELYDDCKAVNDQVIRFASSSALAKTTTIHYCLTTAEGLSALADNNVKGLLGLFGNQRAARTSYGIEEEYALQIRNGRMVSQNGIVFAPIDIVLNMFTREVILDLLSELSHRESIWVMIHEQYFYADYQAYQPDFEEKLRASFGFLTERGYESRFFEDLI